MKTWMRVAIGVVVGLFALSVGLTASGVAQKIILGESRVEAPDVEVEVPTKAGHFPHALLDELQEAYVSEAGRVDYDGLAADERLGRYVALLARVSPSSHPGLFPDKTHALTYWCNAYNALVLWGVVKHRPISSVQEVKIDSLIEAGEGQGFFYSLRFELGGEWVNLYDLENITIRGYKDARIHAAINCASLGCPKLAAFAFKPGALDAQLTEVMRTMVGEERNVGVDHSAKVVRASSIFEWFRGDFEAEHQGLLDFWMKYAGEEKVEDLKKARSGAYRIEFVPYDWGLNAQSPASP